MSQLQLRDYTTERFANILRRRGIISEHQLNEIRRREASIRAQIRREQRETSEERNIRYVVTPAEIIARADLIAEDGRMIDSDLLASALADWLKLPYRKLDPLRLDERFVTQNISQAFARRYCCAPIEKAADGFLVIAVDNPLDPELLQSLEQTYHGRYHFVISSKTDILNIITSVFGFRKAVEAAKREVSVGVDLGNHEQLRKLESLDRIEADDRHVVRAVDYLLHYSLEQGASDIHLEPKRDEAHFRLRIDGILHTIYKMPREVHLAVISRLKTLCRMDIAERRRPQDGRMKVGKGEDEVELRVSSMPVAFGEKLVMRIFDPSAMLLSLDRLGILPHDLKTLQGLIRQPTGMILVTGPTGSGKTTTLYSALRSIHRPDINITTLEDPIEMVYEAFNQVHIHERINLGFAPVLRSILRQDPDVIMVGEIRDPETAKMAMQAALTGHLVLSTLHTNSAPAAITRLQELDVPDYLIASTLRGVLGQRLVRKICGFCKTEGSINADQAALIGVKLPPEHTAGLPVWYGRGCANCRNTGYKGRTGLHEMLPITRPLQKLIVDNADADELERESRSAGMTALREVAIHKLAQGITTYDEIVRVLGQSL